MKITNDLPAVGNCFKTKPAGGNCFKTKISDLRRDKSQTIE